MIGEFKTVRELLADESRWTQGYFAVNKNGNDVPAYAEDAVRFCLLGACKRVYRDFDSESEARRKLRRVIGRGIVTFNDFHSHAEVLAAVIEAGI
jgi:hypothetical protein